jgi:hypothetical protein
MNQNFLTKLSKVTLTVLGIAFATSLFSPALGQLSEESNDNIEVVPQAGNEEVIFQAVLQDLSLRTGIVEISNSNNSAVLESKEWSNSCLELPQESEECFNVATPGWKVTVTNGKESYVYHTNENGSLIKLKQPN